LLGVLVIGGGGLALAACGGAAGTAPVVPTTSSAAGVVSSATAPVSTATRAAPATASAPAAPSSAVATRGTTTPRATASGTARSATAGTPVSGSTADSALLRMLRLVPQRGVTLGRDSFSFADVETQKRNYGFDGLTSYAAFTALPREQSARFLQALGPLPTPQEISFDLAGGAQPNPLAYTFWQIARTGYVGQPKTNWLRLEGRLDTAAIRAALVAAGRTPADYGGATVFARGRDGAIDVTDPLGELGIFGTFNRVTLDDGALTAAPATAAIEGSIDARAGRAPSLADDPDYLAVATALGPVVGASLVPPESLYRPPAPQARGTAVATPATPISGERLPPYRGAGIGMRDDGQTHTMVIALSYESGDIARSAAALVRRRAEEYRLTVGATAQPGGAPLPLLRDLATPGTPQLVTAEGRTVVLLPLAMADTANLGLWRSLLATNDLRFLAE
jgi:hypothetical protein